MWWVIGASATVNIEPNGTNTALGGRGADIQNIGNLIVKSGSTVQMWNGGTIASPYDTKLYNYGYLNLQASGQGTTRYVGSPLETNSTKHPILNLVGLNQTGTIEKTGDWERRFWVGSATSVVW